MSPPLALPKGSLILITGSTGFIGTWTVYEFLRQGYRVRAVVRSEARAAMLREAISNAFSKEPNSQQAPTLETTLITDFTQASSYTAALQDVHGVVQIASDISLNIDPDIVVRNTIAVTTALLTAAQQGSTVQRYTLTSSFVAVDLPDQSAARHYTAESWNDAAVANMHTAQNPFVTYAASKFLGEKAFWAFETESQCHFVRNSVLPAFTIGPALHEETRGSTHGMVRGIWTNDALQIAGMQAFGSRFWWIDVRDVARLLVGCTVLEEVSGWRVLAAVGKYHFNGLLDVMDAMDAERVLPEKIDASEDLTETDHALAEKVLRLMGRDEWIGLEESVRGNVADGLG